MSFSDIRKAGVKFIKGEVRRQADIAATLGASTVTQLGGSFLVARPLTRYVLKRIMGSLGISDDPTDEAIQFIVAPIENGNVPNDLNSIQGKALWRLDQRWRAVGTPANTENPIDNFDVELDEEFDEYNPADVDSQLALALLTRSNTTSTVSGNLIVYADKIMTQNKFVNNPRADYEDAEAEEVGISGTMVCGC